jgi:hypothetical protein
MILHLGFDVWVKVDKVMQHIAQLCTSQAKKASRSVCSIPVADRNEQGCIAGSGTAPPLGWQDAVSPLARGQCFLPERGDRPSTSRPAKASTATDKGHLGSHDRHEQDVSVQWQGRHVQHGACDMLHVHHCFDRHRAVRLWYPPGHD